MNIKITNGEITEKEKKAAIEKIKSKNPHCEIDELILNANGEYIDIEYRLCPQNFERIRRITGYLVGTTERFNNAKKAEEKDRVKHSI